MSGRPYWTTWWDRWHASVITISILVFGFCLFTLLIVSIANPAPGVDDPPSLDEAPYIELVEVGPYDCIILYQYAYRRGIESMECFPRG